METQSETRGEKLQVLVDADCIEAQAINTLTDAQKAAIENLAWSQIYALKEARMATGPVHGTNMI